ncbi:MAG: TraM recognition domain-containing protein [Boseongicola sp. SB0677_bin_26]|nr:TraM recognition domain-containing protein [Boseongicola sp. SB0665_bin_10]MYG25026.1 TraM recognition domain-containing protein [Boseongicola sp. SB0677_bin_26]
MADFSRTNPSLPQAGETVDSTAIRRRVGGPAAGLADLLTHPDTVTVLMLSFAVATFLMPALWTFTGGLSAAYVFWAAGRRYRLPFKAPITWRGKDWGSEAPGRPGVYRDAAAILHFGQDEISREELWIDKDDACRHGFFIGTTGSGKALPLDTLILTPGGWVPNGDLAPGDSVCHPDGGTAQVHSVHPQGRVPAVRLHFEDGRIADCSRDHLWHVRPGPGGLVSDAPTEIPPEGRIMAAGDIGILLGVFPQTDLRVPLACPRTGPDFADDPAEEGRECAASGFSAGTSDSHHMPALLGSPGDRRAFLDGYLAATKARVETEDGVQRISPLGEEEACQLKHVAWSLGGIATTTRRTDGRFALDMTFQADDASEPAGGAGEAGGEGGEAGLAGPGLRVVSVEALDEDREMSCIRVDRADGLYVMENFVTTHNTELLLGVVSQTLTWSSGFLFIDGKGTTEFYARTWTLCKRFGREDDLRVLNFTDPGDDPDAPAGGPSTQSNTLNPFAKGSPDQLMNIIVSLMGDAGAGNDMWKSRAMSLVTALMMGLCELRDRGEILLNVQTIRDFLFLGKGPDKALVPKTVKGPADIPEKAWEEMRSRAGLIELYLRALNGEMSESTRLALKGFFNTLPGFSVENALAGEPQEAKCKEQYGFLSMQLTKPLGSLADGYGHIFRTPLGEIDIDDVVLNRRILVVLLPALQKAPEEMQNCGKIVVALVKTMMGNSSGFELQGTRQEIVDAKPTRSASPFIVVLDEAGYYMVKGIDVMMAQARSLGFMIIVAGQDMAAMQSISQQIAETAAANASILAVGKTVDGARTVQFVQQIVGKTTVSVSSGYSAKTGLMGNTKWMDRMDVSFQEAERIKLQELQALTEGQFYFLFNGRLVRAATFYIGDEFARSFSVNKFLKVRGPLDRVPGLDQSVEIDFLDGYVKVAERIWGDGGNARDDRNDREDGIDREFPAAPDDRLAKISGIALAALARAGRDSGSAIRMNAWISGILAVCGPGQDGAECGDTAWDEEEDVRQAIIQDTLDDLQRERPGRDPNYVPKNRRKRQMTIADAFRQARNGMHPPDRHEGMVEMLKAEKRSLERAEALGHMADKARPAAPVTLLDMFGSMARQTKAIHDVLVEQEAENDLGAQILGRATCLDPFTIPGKGSEGQEWVRSQSESLERAVS